MDISQGNGYTMCLESSNADGQTEPAIVTVHVFYVRNSLTTFLNHYFFKYADGLPPRGHLVPTAQNPHVGFLLRPCEKTGKTLHAIFFAFKHPRRPH